MLTNLRPLRAARHDDEGDAAGTKILLVTNPTVGREEKLEASLLGGVEQCAVAERVQPLACAVSTVCPGSAPISPFGVP